MTELKRLIVVIAFDPDPGTEELLPVMERMQFDSEDRAVRITKDLAGGYAGVIAWALSAEPDIGEYGEPEKLFRYGEIGEME